MPLNLNVNSLSQQSKVNIPGDNSDGNAHGRIFFGECDNSLKSFYY
jgi:hypothetical protein